ncbi:hypothetical protein F0562_023469 [Nyssa sinensis]|uniref:No apical meristem-associated C-terminal domain-containing protein n=1 Tax=Nyssa sinensis TaxID=561372 RepID=A0A5J5BGX5_9ASTE|nr:hypothetical protein F0562_023469 [Nyssa sinensis]
MLKFNKRKEIPIGQRKKTKHYVKHGSKSQKMQSRIRAAKKLYYDSQGHHFKFDSCWLLLKNSAKWFNYTKEHEENKQKIKQRKRRGFTKEVDGIGESSSPSTPATTTSFAIGSINLDDDDSPFHQGSHEFPRPSGRKTAKTIHQKKTTDQLEAINLFVYEFSNLRKEQKELVERKIIINEDRE